MVDHKSKILIIGGTGYIGKFIVEASVKAGHPTVALVRESTVNDPVKGKLIDNFKNLGVKLIYVCILLLSDFFLFFKWSFSWLIWLIDGYEMCGWLFLKLQGDLNEHDGLVKAIKEVDVVISAVGGLQLADQEQIIAAIKQAGNVKVILVSSKSHSLVLSSF